MLSVLSCLVAASAALEPAFFLAPLSRRGEKKIAAGFLMGAAFAMMFAFMGRQIGALLPDPAARFAGIAAVMAGAGRIAKLLQRWVGFEPEGETDDNSLIQLSAATTVHHCACPLSVTIIPGAAGPVQALTFMLGAAAAALLIFVRVKTGGRARAVMYAAAAALTIAAGIVSLTGVSAGLPIL